MTAIAAILGLLLPTILIAADNDHDHNSHQEIAGPVLPLDIINLDAVQAAPAVPPVGGASTSCPGAGSKQSGNTTGSPVLLQTGEFVWVSVDIALAGRPGISLSRAYRAFDSRDGLFGKGWSTHCEKALIPVVDYESSSEPGLAYVYRLANGQRFKFIETSEGEFETPHGLRGLTLVANTDNTATIFSINGADETYNAIGQLISESDRNGNTINYSYTNGALTTIADTNGRSLTFTIDSTGHVSNVTDHTNRRWTYIYNADGSLASVTDPLGGQMTYKYVDITRAASAVVYPVISEIVDESGVTIISVTYDELGRVLSYTEGENEYTYSRSRGLIYKTDSQGSDWSYTLDEVGRKTKVVTPTRGSELYEYNNNSDVTKFTDINGTEFAWAYDELSRMSSSTTPDGTTTYTYQEGTEWPVQITTPSGRVSTIEYDPRGNPIKVTDPEGFQTTFSWSTKGDLLTITDALGGKITQTVNAIGLTTGITDQLGRTTTLGYDNRGNLTTLTNALGNVTQMSYDILDRRINSTDALDHVTSYSLDAVGRLLTLTDANGGTTSFAYDIHGRNSSETRADNSVITYAYRVDNLIESKTDPRGIVNSYSYSEGKELTRIVGSGGENVYLTYDRLSRLSGASYNVTQSYGYDAMSRVTSESTSFRAIGYQYNTEGELTTIDAMNETWNYEYDKRGLLTSFTTPSGKHAYTYDALGRRISHTLPNGSINTFEYDAASQLTKQDYSQTSGDTLSYTYDELGQVTDITSSINTAWNYQYDSINRLTGATHDQVYTYQYDALGNRLENGGVYDTFNKLLTNNDYDFEYDEAGNLISKVSKTSGEQTRYGYNSFGRLSALEIAPMLDATATYTATYTYDYAGRRVGKRANNDSTSYLWKGTDLIGEYSGSRLDNAYRYAGGYAATEFSDANGSYQVQTNHLDTPVTLTDSSDSVVWSQDLSPYGLINSADAVGTDFTQRFAGQYYEANTGLHYNFFRYYDTNTGRYIRSDPIGPRGGLNQYIYASAKPVMFVDFLGLEPTGSDASGQCFDQQIKEKSIFDKLKTSDFGYGRMVEGAIKATNGNKACGDVLDAQRRLGDNMVTAGEPAVPFLTNVTPSGKFATRNKQSEVGALTKFVQWCRGLFKDEGQKE